VLLYFTREGLHGQLKRPKRWGSTFEVPRDPCRPGLPFQVSAVTSPLLPVVPSLPGSILYNASITVGTDRSHPRRTHVLCFVSMSSGSYRKTAHHSMEYLSNVYFKEENIFYLHRKLSLLPLRGAMSLPLLRAF